MSDPPSNQMLNIEGPAGETLFRRIITWCLPDGFLQTFANTWMRPGSTFDELVHDPLVVLDMASYPDQSMVGSGFAFVPGPKAVYHSGPLAEPVEVSGYASLELFLEMDVPDTDLFADLYEVKADGTTIALSGSALRVRHRNGVDRSELFPVGSTERVRFDGFMWFSRLLAKGSRLRLVVAPLNGPYWDKNYNSGGNTIEETGADARTATIRIHHGPGRESRLSLPVVRR